MINTQEDKYIYPPRPESAIPRNGNQIFADLDWIAQFKYNDTRCLIKIKADGRIELWNRHAERIKGYHPPLHLQEQLQYLRERTKGYCLLDGGLLDKKHKAIKNTIVIWDILVIDGQHQLGTTYQERYNIIKQLTNGKPYTWQDHTLGQQITEDILIPDNLKAPQWPQAWETIDQINDQYQNQAGPLIEGLVYKDPTGKLETGFREKNNSKWLCRSRVETGRHKF